VARGGPPTYTRPIMQTAPPFLSGQFLVSMPGMGDPRFDRSVIAVCVHDEESALGLMVNRVRSGIDARELLRQLDVDPGHMPAAPVFAGGPVEPGRGFVLHSSEYEGDSTLSVAGRWGLTATLDILRDIAAGKGPRRWLIALGYAGWGEGQLEDEMTRHGWFSMDGDPALMFDAPVEERWPRAFAAAGIDVSHLSSLSGNA
jgi:putative transcriptional regulator